MRELGDGFLDGMRKLDGHEPTLRLKIIFAFLVDHSQHVVLFSAGVFDDLVDLPELERFFMLFMSDADCVLLRFVAHDQ
jgi:hypothetical protein